MQANVPEGMYTLPEGVLTRHDGSKSASLSFWPIRPPARPFKRLIEGFLGGTSGGALSSKHPENKQENVVTGTIGISDKSTKETSQH